MILSPTITETTYSPNLNKLRSFGRRIITLDAAVVLLSEDSDNVDFNLPEPAPAEPAKSASLLIPLPALTPNEWMKKRYPEVFKSAGEPFQFALKNEGQWDGRNFNEDFFALVFGPLGSPETPVIYHPAEGRFFKYNPSEGFYMEMQEEHFKSFLSRLFHNCAKECRSSHVDTSKLDFQWRTEAKLGGVVGRAKSVLAISDPVFETLKGDEVVCKNGIFSLEKNSLLPFSPRRRFRNKLGVNYVEGAECPRFMEMLNGALDAADIDLFQRWAGQALIGVNRSQSILILTGTAGGGKSTLVNIIEGIIGKYNVATLRTQMLGERFEFFSYVGKTLLRGNDVPIDFLEHKSASILKSLVGADSLHAEVKHGKKAVQIQGSYNILVTSNARLKVHLEGDQAAWKRRLAIVAFSKAAPREEKIVANLAEVLLATEASGILCWMIEGLRKLRAANWQLTVTKDQQRRVEDILEESNSVHHFGRAWLSGSKDAEPVTSDALFQTYRLYCEMRKWKPVSRSTFGGAITDWIEMNIGARESHDIKGGDGTDRKGWRGLHVKGL